MFYMKLMHVWFCHRGLLGKNLAMDNMCGPPGILCVCERQQKHALLQPASRGRSR